MTDWQMPFRSENCDLIFEAIHLAFFLAGGICLQSQAIRHFFRTVAVRSPIQVNLHFFRAGAVHSSLSAISTNKRCCFPSTQDDEYGDHCCIAHVNLHHLSLWRQHSLAQVRCTNRAPLQFADFSLHADSLSENLTICFFSWVLCMPAIFKMTAMYSLLLTSAYRNHVEFHDKVLEKNWLHRAGLLSNFTIEVLLCIVHQIPYLQFDIVINTLIFSGQTSSLCDHFTVRKESCAVWCQSVLKASPSSWHSAPCTTLLSTFYYVHNLSQSCVIQGLQTQVVFSHFLVCDVAWWRITFCSLSFLKRVTSHLGDDWETFGRATLGLYFRLHPRHFPFPATVQRMAMVHGTCRVQLSLTLLLHHLPVQWVCFTFF